MEDKAEYTRAALRYSRLRPYRRKGLPPCTIPEFETVIIFDRNWTHAIFALGQCTFLAGSIEEAIPAAEQAIRLSPRDPEIGLWYWQIGMAHLLLSRTDEAIVWLEKRAAPVPNFGCLTPILPPHTRSKAKSRAAEALAEARTVTPDSRYLSISRLKTAADFGVPNVRALFEATYFAGLRKAGVPEE